MNQTEIIWRERTSDLEAIASIWTCNASELTSRTVLADPCTSIILIQDEQSAQVVLRGPETKPRDELLIPGYTWTAIRLQPGVQLQNFSAEQYTDNFITLSADTAGRFQFEGVPLQFPHFTDAEQLITRMQRLGLIRGKSVVGHDSPIQGISSKSYSRLIKRNTGLSPYKLHQLQRMHQAVQLLKQGMSATTVAAELGFVDQAHLTRAAKQFLGHTPKELRDLPQQP